jgi:hypothetical protein
MYDFDFSRREAAHVYLTGRCGAAPRRVGSGKQNGEAILVGAREGVALPLYEFDFNYLTLQRKKIKC